jgi:predicted XRE-type DNA-binding protein
MAKCDYIESSGNVFADLEIVDAEAMLAKAELAQQIAVILQKRRLTQIQAAAVLGVDQPKVSALLCGRLSRFSLEKLLRFLLLLGTDVAITIRPRQKNRSASRVRAVRRDPSSSNHGRLTVVDSAAIKASHA